MANKNLLEIFLSLNAEDFNRGINAAGTGLQKIGSTGSSSFNAAKQAIGTSTTALKSHNAELAKGDALVGKLQGSFAGLIGAAAGLLSIHELVKTLVETTREFDKINASLITATGSANGAKVAFAAIQDFATKTPYDLAQTSDAFVKLVNFGLDPSTRAMTSYGNTAASMGKSLKQMIEAVADATTNEFERLKEFGIKAKQEGDKVDFTFRGITTTVAKNAKDIENYLIKLGEANFGGAMDERMKTLDGAISNLGDEWKKLALNVSQSGVGEAIAEAVRKATSALAELSAMIVSGEMAGYLKVYSGQWDAWAKDVNTSISLVSSHFNTEMGSVEKKGQSLIEWAVNALKQAPENIRALVQILTVELASFFDSVKANAIYAKDALSAIFSKKSIMGDNSELEAAIKKLAEQEAIITQAKEEQISVILKERDAAVNATQDKIKALKEERAAYDQNAAMSKFQNMETGYDPLKQFGGKNAEAIAAEEKRKADEYKKQQKSKEQLAASTPEAQEKYYAEQRQKWTDIVKNRPLTKDEIKQKKEEEKAARDFETEQKKAAKEKARQDRQAAVETPDNAIVIPSRLAKDRSGQAAEEKAARDAAEDAAQQAESSAAKQASDDAEKAKEEKRKASDEENNRYLLQQRQAVETKKQADAEKLASENQVSDDLEKANTARIENEKKQAADWQATELKAVEAAKAAYQGYYEKVKALQEDVTGRQKTLQADLDELNPNLSDEDRYRKKAAEARKLEKQAKAAMASGDLQTAQSLADQAKSAYKGLKTGAGEIDSATAARTAFSGVKSAGTLGIDIAKAIAASAAAKTPAGGLIPNLAQNVGGQMAAAMPQAAEQQKGGKTIDKVHELRFSGGALQGSSFDIEALLRLLQQYGMAMA